MRCVIIETPFAGDKLANMEYARRCMLDSLERGEAPFVSQLLYTQVYDDDIAEARSKGMKAHHAWQSKAYCMVVYNDLLISGGMQEAITMAEDSGLKIEYRSIGV